MDAEESLYVAVARVEEQVKAQSAMLKDFIDTQKVHNINFAATTLKVEKMEANARGAWWMLGVLGTMVSAVVAWVVTALRH